MELKHEIPELQIIVAFFMIISLLVDFAFYVMHIYKINVSILKRSIFSKSTLLSLSGSIHGKGVQVKYCGRGMFFSGTLEWQKKQFFWSDTKKE